jgi:hypothetical protein
MMKNISPSWRLATFFLCIYLALIALSFGLGWNSVLRFLGTPWFILTMPFLWIIGHNYGTSGLQWISLFCTIPNILLLIRWIAIRYVEEISEVEE